MASAQTASAQTASSTASRDSVGELIAILELDSDIDKSITEAGFYFKNVPKDPNPEIQKQIAALYAKAQAEFENQRGAQKLKLTTELREKLTKNFSEEELKYLITLARYPITKKLRAFMAVYSDLIGKPYTDTRLQVINLKAQVDALKKTGKSP